MADPWKGHAIRDRELVTGQNPMSEADFGDLFLEALMEQRLTPKSPIQYWSPSGIEETKLKTVTNVMTNLIDWSSGYTTIYIGAKKSGLSNAAFLKGMKTHIKEVQGEFSKMGLKGYIFYLDREYEVAYLNWGSQKVAEVAFGSVAAKAIVSEAGNLLDPVLFKQTTKSPVVTVAEKYERPRSNCGRFR